MKLKKYKEFISINEDLDKDIVDTYLDFRDDEMLNHKEALEKTSQKMNIADTDIEQTLKEKDIDISESRVNEGRETLKAQDASKASLFKLDRVVSEFLKQSQRKSLVKSFKGDISPYNNGYKLKFEFEPADGVTMYRFNKSRELGIETDEVPVPAVIRFYNNFWKSIQFDIQPETFFEKHLLEDGKARMTGAYHEYDDRKKRFERVYLKEEVTDISQIPSVTRLYTERASKLFENLIKRLENFNF